MKKYLQRLYLIFTVCISLLALNACGNILSKNAKSLGFNEATNQIITFQGISFSIPKYYDFRDTQSTKDYVHYYPENEDYFSSLIFLAEDAGITPTVESILESTKGNFTITDTEDITVAGLPAIKVSFTEKESEIITTGHIVFVNNIYESKLILIVQVHDSKDQSNFDYDSDFVKILESAMMTKVNASESISNNTQESIESSKPVTSEMMGSGDLGDYYVEIKGGQLARDYDNNLACIVTYSWTNNSDETTAALYTIKEKAFQDGVELERAFIWESDTYDSDTSMKDVKPGATVDVQFAFVLANETSDIEVELSELFNFSKKQPKVTKTFVLE